MNNQSIVKQLNTLTGSQFAYVCRFPATWESGKHIATCTEAGITVALKRPTPARKEVLTIELARDKQAHARQLVRTIIDQQ